MDSIGSYGSGGSVDHIRRQQEMFSKIDTDGDGQFSLEEFEAAKPADAPDDAPAASEIFAQIDSDGDGFVTEDEFAKAPPPPPPPPKGGGSNIEDETLSTLLQLLEDYTSTSSEDEIAATTSTTDSDDSEETSAEDILELIQEELENYRNSAFTQANNAYSNASDLGMYMAQQQQIFAST